MSERVTLRLLADSAHPPLTSCQNHIDPGIAFNDDAGRQKRLEGIGLGQLAAEMAWLRGRLEGEDHGTTRAKEVGGCVLWVVG